MPGHRRGRPQADGVAELPRARGYPYLTTQSLIAASIRCWRGGRAEASSPSNASRSS
ncbi:hypothetical protein ACFQHO_11530 [Actinomadura yumaensis]|uniref:hypothetical protein n=1 Tax=Actinomadura yumaensis TaxID=111807 RepID=UPI00360DF6C2